MKVDRFKTAEGTFFEGMQCETMSVHHAPDGAAVGFRAISPQGEELYLVFRGQLIDVMPEVFAGIAKESRMLREPSPRFD